MSPFGGDAVWDPQGINGVYRWLGRVWDMAQPVGFRRGANGPAAEDVTRAVHKTIKRVGGDLETFQFNTAISALMELSNLMQRSREALEGTDIWTWAVEQLLIMMAPMTPHISEELWHAHGHTESVHLQAWPEYDEVMTLDEVVTIVVQVNGKVRDRLEVPRGEEEESVKEQALASPRVQPYTEGREIVRVVTVPEKLVNIVVR
jgi:leucyl-tRNA synthetase